MFCRKTPAHEIVMPWRLHFRNSVDKVTALLKLQHFSFRLNLGTLFLIHYQALVININKTVNML